MKKRDLKTQLSYTCKGRGKKTLLLIHGLLESAAMWHIVLPFFDEEEYCLYTIDLPGHGDSPVCENGNDLSVLAELIHAFLKGQKRSQVSIIGHSLGGYLALALAEKYPDDVVKMVLLNSSSLADSETRKKDRNRVIRLLYKHPQAFKSMAVKNLFLPETFEIYKSEINRAAQVAQKCETAALIMTLEAMRDRKDRSTVLCHFRSQSLLIFGDQDQIANPQAMESVIDRCQLSTEILSGGHMSLIEHHEKVMCLLKDFL